jgi:hypothetical protein
LTCLVLGFCSQIFQDENQPNPQADQRCQLQEAYEADILRFHALFSCLPLFQPKFVVYMIA